MADSHTKRVKMGELDHIFSCFEDHIDNWAELDKLISFNGQSQSYHLREWTSTTVHNYKSSTSYLPKDWDARANSDSGLALGVVAVGVSGDNIR